MACNSLEILMSSIASDASDKEVLTFLHNTGTEQKAKKIVKYGFRFNSHLDYSTDNVSAKDEVTVRYFTLTRQAYGNYTVIIQIARNIIEHYSTILDNTPHHFSEVLTVCPPVLGNDEEFIYQLAPQFIKGYIYMPKCELVLNEKFNPECDCDIFKENLSLILEQLK